MIQANLLLSRPFIKINACLIGYGLWIIFSQHQIITTKVQAPLCFYKTADDVMIIAPDTIDLIITGSKKSLQRFDAYHSAIHLNASHLQDGFNHVLLQKENLFLPDEINLVSLVPSSVQIQLQKTDSIMKTE
ncbi:MAG: hypothetical protein Q8Q60_03015 [Candidatus Chromulinivorax sp.]|nr:hypothetical protein [Candidatus Chromulinivorax sp.]